MKKIFNFLRLLKSHINGDFAYENYLNHQRRNHPKQEPLDKNSFLKQKEKEKWRKVNRCC